MPLTIYNSLNRKKEIFKPIEPPKVKMYCCGPTVYDLLHIGNFRGAVFYNFARQWLEHNGYQVTYAYNFTDIDDKILDRAKKENKTMKEITEKYITEFQTDYKSLKLRKHENNPKATEFIPNMIHLIQDLCEKGKAYCIEGDVFFHVPSFKGYGKLSGRKKEDLMSGARVEVDDRKKDPRDFALWKACEKTEPGWDSPWGRGRPGWHIECTSMIHSLLGQHIDIHGGGTDLIFPHHENEIAQSEATINSGATNKAFVKYWIHHNMFTFEGEKMAKSLGNLITMRQFLKSYNGEIFKYLVLSAHYRSKISISEKTILQSIQSLSRVYSFLKTANNFETNKHLSKHSDRLEHIKSPDKKIQQALNDDFNTPSALAVLFTLIRQFNEHRQTNEKQKTFTLALKQLILKYGKIMGLFQEPASLFLKQLDDIFLRKNNLNRKDIDLMVQERSLARKNKNFKKADEIRNHLLTLGIEVQDSPEGSVWETKKNFLPE